MTTSQGEALLAKYLHDSLRTIEQTVRKAAPAGAPAGALPRSISTGRADGRRAATEVLLPRGTTRSLAPVAAAAAAAHATRRDLDYTMGRPQAQVVMTQARKQQQQQLGSSGSPQQQQQQQHLTGGGSGGSYTIPAQRGPSGGGGSPALPPRPTVVRTAAANANAAAAAVQMHRQLNMAYGSPGASRGGAAGRAISAPRDLHQHHQHSHNGHHQHHQHQHQHQHHHTTGAAAGHTRSEARVPAVTAAPALLTAPGRHGGDGGGGGGLDAKGPAGVRRGAPSETGTNASWWRKPITDASYPLTAITDRYAQSMSQSELVRWNDRVARLEAEINAEKERRKHFEAELKKVQAVTGGSGGGAKPGAGTGQAAGPAAVGRGGATVAASGGGAASSRGATAGAGGGVRAALQYV